LRSPPETELIERLPDDLINKIAAGEVVERPASVVKELLENALDAGARSVGVEIEGGGKSLIRVRDDGSGMGRQDAQRALERHATSKLRTLDDLQQVATHGFRGEALPSIASVGLMVVRTREATSPAGTEIEVRHGRIAYVRDAGHPVGTTVEVRDLFGAVPARRKFLRADATEVSHVAEAVTLLALAQPPVGFRLTSSGRTLVDAPPADGLAARVYQVFGGTVLEDLIPVEGGEGWATVRGLVSRPDRPIPARASLRLFVNGRAVRDRALSKALLEAYRKAGAGDKRPEAFLFVEVPLPLVDVNVHPAKTEVRFADSRTIFRAVERAVRDGLSSGVRREGPRPDVPRVQEATERFLAVPRPLFEAPASPEAPQAAEQAPAVAQIATVLGQHRNTYIVASDGENLLLVDQHTAHERVRYEALVERLARRTPESQLLLAPAVVTLPPRLRAVLETHQEALLAVGFEVEAFGGGALRVRAVPALLAGADPERTLGSVLADLVERVGTDWAVTSQKERLAATLACHSAVRAGQPLTQPAMAAILKDLAQTEHPTLCPHGRPTIVRLPREDVARWFGRGGWRRE
jgi:DNA mismatch repair protein MutL